MYCTLDVINWIIRMLSKLDGNRQWNLLNLHNRKKTEKSIR